MAERHREDTAGRGRRARAVAGRGAVAKSHREDVAGRERRDRAVAGRGAAAKSHREDIAGRGAVAERHREVVAGGGAVTELLLAGALRRRAVGNLLLAGVPCGKTMRQHREAAAEGYHLRSLLWYSGRSLGRKRHREMSCGINGCCARCLANIVRISSRVVEIILLGSSR